MERRKLLIGLAAAEAATHRSARGATTGKPAMLGGTPVRTEAFPSWPITDDTEERALTGVLRSGKWGRGVGNQVNRFEQQYAQAMGAKHCLAAANGTSALLISLQAMGIGPGDEVIVPPYTFVATINTILAQHALPVFVDTDLETFQIDARKIEAAITPRTVAVMPVHLGGNVADLDTIMAISQKRNIPVLEDACQAHLAEWKNRKVGTLGKAGTFSFQASKNLNSGEGGAVLTNDPEFVERCFAFHNNGRGRNTAGYDFSYLDRGLNLRLTEFQAALLIAQMNRLEKQSSVREQNAAYLNKELAQIAGIVPAKQYGGTTRNAYHLYMFRYEAARFNGLSRNKFLKAMQAEGIPVSGGYSPLNKEPFLRNTLTSKGFKRIYSEAEITRWQERNQCPLNDRLCGEAVWLTQTMLLGPRSDMEQIVAAVRKVQQNSAELAKA
ncbi:MAG TPA: DegT/DnrJ/EryC1/StrS family aminotransferase [Bryobacteraceae bacterium]|nr:DegT/DnrJ/EryC1/StrS family aminotransferase [Bryobacteraceae bacterium]